MKKLFLSSVAAILGIMVTSSAFAQHRTVVVNNYHGNYHPYYNRGYNNQAGAAAIGFGAGILTGILLESMRPPAPPAQVIMVQPQPRTDCVQVVIGYTVGGQPLLRNYCN